MESLVKTLYNCLQTVVPSTIMNSIIGNKYSGLTKKDQKIYGHRQISYY